MITLRVVFAHVAHPSLLKVRITVQGMSASQCDKVRLTDLVLANNLGGTTLECNDQYFSDPLCQRIGGCESMERLDRWAMLRQERSEGMRRHQEETAGRRSLRHALWMQISRSLSLVGCAT